MGRYPFLLSVPHAGTLIPEEIRNLIVLSNQEISYYSDLATMTLFRYPDRVISYLDTEISRMAVDLNRPPYHLPPRYQDGVIKVRTADNTLVYRGDAIPDIRIIHRLLMEHYFPYHAEIDRLLDPAKIGLAMDCHSMLPRGPPSYKDAGKERPLICLGNNGDTCGEPREGRLATCPASWIRALAAHFVDELGASDAVAINRPFSGGFITNAHYWHKGIPWIQIEVNRKLYEKEQGDHGISGVDQYLLSSTGTSIWNAICSFWDAREPEEPSPSITR